LRNEIHTTRHRCRGDRGVRFGDRCPAWLRVACPPANDRHADLTAAQSASDDAVNTAATVRNEYYITSGRPYWQAVKDEGRAANYDAVFGPGAFFQNYELPGYPSY
jgi:hypothetical protein